MNSMVERAAKASFCQEHGSDGCVWEQSSEDSKGYWCDSARAALLAALDPEDHELWDEIGCEIGGGSGDEAQAVEAAFYVRLVIRELRKRIAQGGPSS